MVTPENPALIGQQDPVPLRGLRAPAGEIQVIARVLPAFNVSR